MPLSTKVKRQLFAAVASFTCVWWAGALAAIGGYVVMRPDLSGWDLLVNFYSSRRFTFWLQGASIAGAAAGILQFIPLIPSRRNEPPQVTRKRIWFYLFGALILTAVTAAISHLQMIDSH